MRAEVEERKTLVEIDFPTEIFFNIFSAHLSSPRGDGRCRPLRGRARGRGREGTLKTKKRTKPKRRKGRPKRRRGDRSVGDEQSAITMTTKEEE